MNKWQTALSRAESVVSCDLANISGMEKTSLKSKTYTQRQLKLRQE